MKVRFTEEKCPVDGEDLSVLADGRLLCRKCWRHLSAEECGCCGAVALEGNLKALTGVMYEHLELGQICKTCYKELVVNDS